MQMVIKCLSLKTHANASKICVSKHNYIHTCSIKTQPTNTTYELVYTFEYDAIFVILQDQVVIPTKYTRTNLLCSSKKNPNLASQSKYSSKHS
jgi:hypothetical protein